MKHVIEIQPHEYVEIEIRYPDGRAFGPPLPSTCT